MLPIDSQTTRIPHSATAQLLISSVNILIDVIMQKDPPSQHSSGIIEIYSNRVLREPRTKPEKL